MKFYATRSDGFRPSLKMIDDAIGIGEKHVSTVRQALVRYGLIAYDGKTILIDWMRLHAFAAAEPRLMGRKKDWKITPVAPNLLGEPKSGVHTYRGTRVSHLYDLYVATQQAVAGGVIFPELSGKETDNLLGDTKTQVHTYRETRVSPEWYNPFDKDDPSWVYQVPIVDAYGEIVAYAHYSIVLPF